MSGVAAATLGPGNVSPRHVVEAARSFGTPLYLYDESAIIERCRELNLRLVDSEESTKTDFLVFLTVQTMNYLHSGRHRVAL